ncbi:MAG: glycoside hydrolase family 31 protein [Chitinophagales bacterium]
MSHCYGLINNDRRNPLFLFWKTFILTVIPSLAFFISEASGQVLPVTLGNFKSAKKITNGISIQTSSGNLKAVVYSSSVIKINVTRNAVFDDFSYAVVATPDESVRFSVQDGVQHISIITDSLQLIIQKKPVRITLLNKSGKTVNEDDAAFGTSWVGNEITSYKKLFPSEKFIGLGEKTGELNRRGNAYVNWNTDAFGYSDRTDPLYCTIPFYIGIHDSLVYGIFLDNSSRTHFNFGASQNRFSSFAAEDGDMNYFLIYNSTVAKIIESYTWLTGRMPMPPLWSLGFHQCRYSYYPEVKLLSIAQTFRDKKIPCDVLWFDIHYMQDYKVFTWNQDRFPDPKGMLGKLESLGFKTVSIIDPGIKAEPGYFAYDEGLKNDQFLKYSDGSVYLGAVWPGWCAFSDYTRAESRKWWGTLFRQNISDGLDGFWCDMNEIATWGQSIPSNVILNFDGHPATYRMGKNIYGFQMARATYEGTKELLNGKRPFVLTRAGYAGLQRYTAIWTGDNLAEENHMLLGVRLVNSLGLSGVPFAGVDVGGFAGETSSDLMARWIAVGSFSPFFRAHKVINGKDAEPWSFGEKTEEICRNYIQLRYNLLPYIYSAYYEATQTGIPLQRSLAINYFNDEKIYKGNAVNEYLFGQSFLIVPYVTTQAAVPVYLPTGDWYELYTDKKYQGENEFYHNAPVEKLPVFVKAGSIIPMQSAIQTTAVKPADTLTIHFYNGPEKNMFIYYEDSGNGYEYTTGGYYSREIFFDPLAREIVLDKPQGSYSSHFKNLRLIFHGFDEKTLLLKINDSPLTLKHEEISFISSLQKFDPLGAISQLSNSRLPIAEMKNSTAKIVISYASY